MRTNDDIEAYLIELGVPFEQVEEGMWVLHDEFEHINNIVIFHTPPVIIFRVKLMELPENPSVEHLKELYEQLLVLNATDMVHGAYGLEDNNIVCVDSLQSENLDFNEFQASVEAVSVAISTHYNILKRFRVANTADGEEESAGGAGDASEEQAPGAG